jgi:hypothetical protein
MPRRTDTLPHGAIAAQNGQNTQAAGGLPPQVPAAYAWCSGDNDKSSTLD